MNITREENKKLTFADLEEEFNFLLNSKYGGINGVHVIDSGKPGPSVGVTIMTHGNEPSGIACAKYFRNEGDLQQRLICGKVVMVLNNIEGGKKYFEAKKMNDQEAIRKARYIDVNMNRLPTELNESEKSEIVRSRRLLPVWTTFDLAIDIHSTTQKSDPMIIAVGELNQSMFKGFPMDNIISNIEKIQIGKPASAFYGNATKNIPVLIIETGSHDDSASFDRAIVSVNNFLHNAGLIDEINKSSLPKKYKLYDVQGSLIVPNLSYSLTRVFETYEFVKKGEVLARGDQGEIIMPFDGHTLMGPKDTTIHDIAEEVLFLTLPVKEILC